MKSTLRMFCAVAALLPLVVGCGRMLDGKIYGLSKPLVLPMQIQVSTGHGKMTAVNPDTGEKFEGEYTGVRGGAVGYAAGSNGTVVANVQADTARAEAVLVGDKGTVLNCDMTIKAGLTPHGMGTAKDNHGNEYKILF